MLKCLLLEVLLLKLGTPEEQRLSIRVIDREWLASVVTRESG